MDKECSTHRSLPGNVEMSEFLYLSEATKTKMEEDSCNMEVVSKHVHDLTPTEGREYLHSVTQVFKTQKRLTPENLSQLLALSVLLNTKERSETEDPVKSVYALLDDQLQLMEAFSPSEHYGASDPEYRKLTRKFEKKLMTTLTSSVRASLQKMTNTLPKREPGSLNESSSTQFEPLKARLAAVEKSWKKTSLH